MGTEKPGRISRFVSLRIKLLVGFTLVFSVIFAAAFFWFYNFATAMALSRIEEDLLDTLNGTISGINGDEFAAMAQDAVPDSSGVPADDPRYQAHQQWLRNVYDIEPRAIPYTFVSANDPANPYRILWIGDSFRFIPERIPSQTKWRDPYEALPENTKLYQGLTQVTVNMKPYDDDWGTWVSAYGPIRNSAGEVVGGAAIDFEASYVYEVQRNIQNSVLPAFGITYSILFLLVLLLSGGVTSPLIALTRSAERIGEGDYDQDLSALTQDRFPDEIDTLAQVFSIMIAKVYQREQTLRRRVEELQIMVDEGKKKQQVEEIVESDFFRELQDKARTMRNRITTKTTKKK